MFGIIRKELRQGRPLLIFSVAVALLLLAVRLLVGGPNITWGLMSACLLEAVLILPLVLALFAGIGLFAAETEHGVLPVLLVLPLSRARLWAAKLIAGALLTLLGSAVILLTAKFFLPAAFPFVGLTPWVDVALAALFLLSLGMFVTVLSPHVIGAGVGAVALGVGILIGISIFRQGYGAWLLGYDLALEIELWLALTAPALLLASRSALIRGELLDSPRTALLRLPLLLLGLAVTAGLVSLAGRALTRYDRALTGRIVAAPTRSGAPAVALLSANNPVSYTRDRVGADEEGQIGKIGWGRRAAVEGDVTSPGSDPLTNGLPYYRNHEVVVLDPGTGKELLAQRDSVLHADPMAAISPDGRYAALATAPVGATWGGEPACTAARYLQVWELPTRRRLYAGTPTFLRGKSYREAGVTGLSWSPTGRYLALSVDWSEKGAYALYLMRPEGGETCLNLPSPPVHWTWDRRRDVLYVVSSGAIVRVTPPGTSAAWRTDLRTVSQLEASGLSPDGHWLALAASGGSAAMMAGAARTGPSPLRPPSDRHGRRPLSGVVGDARELEFLVRLARGKPLRAGDAAGGGRPRHSDDGEFASLASGGGACDRPRRGPLCGRQALFHR